MVLNGISVIGKVEKMKPWKNCTSKASLIASKEWKYTSGQNGPDSPYSFSPIDYCVRINALPARLFSGDIQS